MAGWHHWLDGRESEWTPGVDDGQGGLACCDSWGRKELDTTELLNWTEPRGALKVYGKIYKYCRGHGNPLQYSCLENPHGQRSLAGYSPWGRRVGHNWVTKHSTAHANTTPFYKRDLSILEFWNPQGGGWGPGTNFSHSSPPPQGYCVHLCLTGLL